MTTDELRQQRIDNLAKARAVRSANLHPETAKPDIKAKLRALLGKDYLTEEERDEVDRLLTIRRSDPDLNLDEELNN